MSDVSNEPEVPVLDVETATRPLSVGERLQAAREAKGMKLADLAQTMKLSVRQLEALEAGNWQALPGVTFVRGFVRNYARMVDIDPTPLMAELEGALVREKPNLALPESAPVSMPQGGPAERRDYAFALAGLLLVLVAAGLYWLAPNDLVSWRDRLQSMISSFSQPAAVPPAPPVEEPVAVLPPGASVMDTLHPQNVEPSADAAAPATGEPPVAPAAAVEAAKPVGDATLLINVSKESWVEVRDRNGNVLLSQRVPDQSERRLDGQGPFVMVLGNAPGVKVSFKGKEVDLAPHTKGDVARLTLE